MDKFTKNGVREAFHPCVRVFPVSHETVPSQSNKYIKYGDSEIHKLQFGVLISSSTLEFQWLKHYF